jgi:hypothetical protein
LQDTQSPSHPLSQHTPSTQKPEAQALALEQVVPFLALQLPLLSHAWPGQLPETSVPPAAAVQVPSWPATAQDWQDPEQAALAQQTPSTQKPEAQLAAVAAEQPSPLPRFVTSYSQVSVRSEPSEAAQNSTITPRWLSKAMGAPPPPAASAEKVRRYQVGPRGSSSQVLTPMVWLVGSESDVTITWRRRRLS